MINLRDHSKIKLGESATILDAISNLNDSALQIVAVVDQSDCLLGVVTDGDIRRAILEAIPLDSPVIEIMNISPTTIKDGLGDIEIFSIFSKHEHLLRIPAINDNNQIIGLYLAEDLITQNISDVPVILMAGGLGSRLRPITEDIPKPMIDINGKPILEHILSDFKSYGFSKFFISVNYLRDKIKNYFQDGRGFGVDIEYIDEFERLGTGGALRLLPKEVKFPIIVMNGDLLTTLNFVNLLNHHNESKSAATMCVRPYSFRVPYGVVDFDGNQLNGIVEKPQHFHFVNAGIYVIGREAMDLVPNEGLFDMPSLFKEILEKTPLSANVFPLHENWTDIGNISDLNAARAEKAKR